MNKFINVLKALFYTIYSAYRPQWKLNAQINGNVFIINGNVFHLFSLKILEVSMKIINK